MRLETCIGNWDSCLGTTDFLALMLIIIVGLIMWHLIKKQKQRKKKYLEELKIDNELKKFERAHGKDKWEEEDG